MVVRDGRQEMIEYSDLPGELAERRAPDGGLDLLGGLDRPARDRRRVRGPAGDERWTAAVPPGAQGGAVRGRGGAAGRARRAERGQVRAVHLRRTPAREAGARGRDRPRDRVRAAEERRGAGVARDRPGAALGALRRLAGGGRRRGAARGPTARRSTGSRSARFGRSTRTICAGRSIPGSTSRAPCCSPDEGGTPRRPRVTRRLAALGRALPARRSPARRGAPSVRPRQEPLCGPCLRALPSSPGRRVTAAGARRCCPSATAASARAAGSGSGARLPPWRTRAAGVSWSRQLKSGAPARPGRPRGGRSSRRSSTRAECEAVCWVPGDRWRTIRRGYHPAELLAREAARRGASRPSTCSSRPVCGGRSAGSTRRRGGETCAARSGCGASCRARDGRARRRRVHDGRHPRRLRAGRSAAAERRSSTASRSPARCASDRLWFRAIPSARRSRP